MSSYGPGATTFPKSEVWVWCLRSSYRIDRMTTAMEQTMGITRDTVGVPPVIFTPSSPGFCTHASELGNLASWQLLYFMPHGSMATNTWLAPGWLSMLMKGLIALACPSSHEQLAL